MARRKSSCMGIWSRHWFSYFNHPGTSAPMCVRCGNAPNPKYDPDRDIFRQK